MQSSNIPNVWRPRHGALGNPGFDRFREPVHTSEQTLFLKRFVALLDKRDRQADLLPEGDWRRRLIDKALYSTYCDCLDLDVRDEVRDILERGRTGTGEKPVVTA